MQRGDNSRGVIVGHSVMGQSESAKEGRVLFCSVLFCSRQLGASVYFCSVLWRSDGDRGWLAT